MREKTILKSLLTAALALAAMPFNPYAELLDETSVRIEAESYSANYIAAANGFYVGNCNNGAWLKYSNVDLKYGAIGFSARVAAMDYGPRGQIQVRIGSTTGELIGTLTVYGTGGGDIYQKQSCALSGSYSGRKDIFLLFSGGTALCLIDNVEFNVHSDYFQRLDATAYSAAYNISIGPVMPDGTLGAVQTASTSWLKFADIDLNYGAYFLKARVKNNGTSGSGTVQVREGSSVGPLIGSITVPAGNAGNCADFSVDLGNPAIIGTHDLFVVLSNAQGCAFSIECAELSVYKQPTIRLQAESFIAQSGILTATSPFNETYVGWCDEGDWIKFPNIDLKWGIASMKGHVARDGPWYGGRIELWTDYENVTLKKKIGEMHVWGTGDWELFTDQKNDFFGKGYGVHDVYFVFYGSGVCNVDWIELELNGEALVRKEADQFSQQSGVRIESSTNRLISCDQGDWVCYSGIDMKGGATGIDIKLSSQSGGFIGDIEIRLDGPNGPLMGTLYIQNTGSFEQFSVQHATLSGATDRNARGIHTLCFVFHSDHSSAPDIAHLDWFELTLKRLPYFRWEADWYDDQSGIYVISGEPRTIGGCDNGDWVKYAGVDMQKGAISFKANMARDGQGFNGYIEIRVGNPVTGPLLGRLASQGTGGWGTFKEQSTELSGDAIIDADGVRDLYLCFRDGGGVCNLDWFEITFEDRSDGLRMVRQSEYIEDLVFERDKTNQVVYQYQSIGGDGRMLMPDNTAQQDRPRSYYIKDHLGSTRMVINDNGIATETMIYDAYGRSYPLGTSAGTENTKEKFTGKELDDDGRVSSIYADISVGSLPVDNNITGTLEITLAGGEIILFPLAFQTVGSTLQAYVQGAQAIPMESSVQRIDLKIQNSSGTKYVWYLLDKGCYSVTNGDELRISLSEASYTALPNTANILTTPDKYTYAVSAQPAMYAGMDLIYFGARYLDPEAGIWTSSDPLRQFYDGYSYVGGDAVNYIDPWGLDGGPICPEGMVPGKNGECITWEEWFIEGDWWWDDICQTWRHWMTPSYMRGQCGDEGAGGNPPSGGGTGGGGAGGGGGGGGGGLISAPTAPNQNPFSGMRLSSVGTPGAPGAGVNSYEPQYTKGETVLLPQGSYIPVIRPATTITPDMMAFDVFVLQPAYFMTFEGIGEGINALRMYRAAQFMLPEDAASTFKGTIRSFTLKSDVTAYRYSGGISSPKGRFLTTRQTVAGIKSPAQAIKALKLPAGSTAEKLNTFIIPKGTKIFIGRIAGGESDATQVFIKNSNALKPVR